MGGGGSGPLSQPRQSTDFLALDLPGVGGAGGPGGQEGGYMEMQLAQGQGEVRFPSSFLRSEDGEEEADEADTLGPRAQDQYLNQRSTAIETIESTVAELGQIFSQLATMIAVQGEQVTRIDADTEEIATNVSGAQGCAALLAFFDVGEKTEKLNLIGLRNRELLRYYSSISSNRWLMMKVRRARRLRLYCRYLSNLWCLLLRFSGS